MMSKIVKYENIRNEQFNIVNFNNNGKLEYLLVHSFENDLGNDYFVIGKFNGDVASILKDGNVYKEVIKKIILKYKSERENILENNSDKYYEISLIHNFLFTKEGYDLVTHKFLFTNNEVIKTVEIEQQNINNVKYFKNNYYSIDNIKNVFEQFDVFEKYYTLRKEEFEKISLDNIFSYVRSNLKKVTNLVFLAKSLNIENSEINNFYSDFELLNIMSKYINDINALMLKRKRNEKKFVKK